ncbi:MAG: 3-isopropylmalate dehydratase small subunit [Pararhizobium sp.]
MIEPLIHVNSRAVTIPDANVDTDIIFPARYLLKIDREGMDQCLFQDRRFRPDGTIIPDFPLNKEGFQDAKIIVAGPGFGCGSSREQAVWALVDYGIRVIIGTDFGDIFSGNAPKNGMLLIRTDPDTWATLAAHAQSERFFDVDLRRRHVTVDGEEVLRFALSDLALQAYVNGWDEMDVIMNTEVEHISKFEHAHQRCQPWLFVDR